MAEWERKPQLSVFTSQHTGLAVVFIMGREQMKDSCFCRASTPSSSYLPSVLDYVVLRKLGRHDFPSWHVICLLVYGYV